ncbi:MAG: four helix bundle protein [Ignavibacteriales bacterium]|nr:four helix bundle protein [Ignavibacteriales bacterium]
MYQDIVERTFNFGVKIVNLTSKLPQSREGYVLGKQLLRSGTSIGANVEEAESGYTKDVFTYKMNIALSEARETHYWLRMIDAIKFIEQFSLNEMISEADEIKRILGAIVSKARNKSKR